MFCNSEKYFRKRIIANEKISHFRKITLINPFCHSNTISMYLILSQVPPKERSMVSSKKKKNIDLSFEGNAVR